MLSVDQLQIFGRIAAKSTMLLQDFLLKLRESSSK